MAKDNVIGLKAKIDTLGLKAGVKEITKYTKEADEAFKNATAGMGKWSDSSEGLKAKLDQLDKNLEANKATAAAYKKEIERVSKLEGDRSKQLEELNKKYNAANREIKNTEESIEHYSKSLEKVQKEEEQSNSSLGKLTKTIKAQKEELKDLQDEYKSAILSYGENSDEANNLKNQIEKLNSSLEENENTLKSVEDAANGAAKSFDKAEDESKGFSKGLEGIKKIGAGVAKSVAALGAAVAGIGAAFLSTAGATKEYRTNMGKLEAGFETSGLKAEQAAETYKQLYAVVADEGKATEATAMLGQLAKSQEDLNKWVNISTGVYATFGDSLPIESLAEAALETSKTGKLTGGLADALNWAGISEEGFQAALDACSTEQERQTLITETLNGVYDDASQKYQQVNKDVIESNKAQANLTDTMAKFGEKAEPIITKVKEGFTKILEEVLKLTENIDWDAIGESIDNAFAYFIDTIIPAIVDGFQWIMDNKETLLAGIVGIGTAMLAWNVVSMVQGLVTAIKGWTTATTGMTAAQKLLNLAMKANPIGIVITVITGLIAAIVTLWTTNEDFRNKVIEIWNKVKESISKAIETIKIKFEEFKTKAIEVVGNVIEFFKDIPNKIKEGFNKIKEVGKNLVEGLWTGIKDTASWIKKKIKGWVNDRLDDIKGFFGIHSPSKETAEMGGYLVEGLEQGIEDETPALTSELENFAEGTLGTIEEGLEGSEKIGENFGKNIAEGLKKSSKDIEKQSEKIKTSLEDVSTVAQPTVAQPTENSKEEKQIKALEAVLNEIEFLEKIEKKYLSLKKEVENLTKQLIYNNNADTAAKLDAKQKELQSSQDEYFANKVNTALPALKEDLELVQKNIGKSEYERLLKKIEERKAKPVSSLGKASKFQIGNSASDSTSFVDSLELGSKNKGELAAYFNSLEEDKEPEEKKLPEVAEWFSNIIEKVDSVGQKLSGFGEKVKSAVGMSSDQLTVWEAKVGENLTTFAKSMENTFGLIGNAALDISKFLIDNWSDKEKELNKELAAFKKEKDEELKTYKNIEAEKQKELSASLEAGEITQEQYKLKQKESALELAKTQAKIEEQKRLEEEKTLKKKNELAKKQFIAQKANDIATATMNGAQAILKGFADLGPIGGAINAAVQAGITAAQIATIASQKFVPALAKGGIVDNPTLALVGEAGKEAVMPLENNTGWISELAYKLNNIMSKDISSGVAMGAVNNTVNNTYNYYQTINAPKTPNRRELYRDTKNLLSLKAATT